VCVSRLGLILSCTQWHSDGVAPQRQMTVTWAPETASFDAILSVLCTRILVIKASRHSSLSTLTIYSLCTTRCTIRCLGISVPFA
jgi:hypothetical protein